MEMEYLNEHTMRVFIGTEDLKDRGITFSDMVGDQEAVENFFLNILEEVDVSNKFQNSDAITFQVLPKKDGIDLYISKANDNIAAITEERAAFQNLMDTVDHMLEDEEELEDVLQSQINELDEGAVFSFPKVDDLLNLAADFDSSALKSSLYYHNEAYVLLIELTDPEFSAEEKTDLLYQLAEYGHFEPQRAGFYREYAKPLLGEDALAFLKQHFYA